MTTTYGNIPQSYRNYPISASVNDVSLGLGYPLADGVTGTLFSQTYTTIDQAKANIQCLLATMPKERLMHPTLGSGLHKILFEQINDPEEFSVTIKEVIRESIETWLPYINIDKIDVSFQIDNNQVNVSLTFSLKNDPTIQDTVNLSISAGDL